MECINDSTWAVVVLAKDGKLNFESSIIYEPYAFIRVDNTDNYGGGTLKAIDPKHPMEDGITLGRTETYNFQTFLTRRDVFTDGNGGIVLYAKNDLDHSNNAYYMNLTKENSLVNLTNEKAPDISEINGNSGHCHGRYCTVCHAFSESSLNQNEKGVSDPSVQILFCITFVAINILWAKGRISNEPATISKLTKPNCL
jgi:hypothetical protein